MNDNWTKILSRQEIVEYFSKLAELDPAFAVDSREWWMRQTDDQLRVAAARAYRCDAGEEYQLAVSILALRLP